MSDLSPNLPDASDRARPTALSFPAFVLSLAQTAAVHFGDLAEPGTGRKGAVNLLGARQMIDILALLEDKTRGNLSAEERQLLEQLLVELRERYQEAERAQASHAAPPRVDPS